jgi:hypothetical protein
MIEIKLNTRHIKHFESLGYVIPRYPNKNGKLRFVNGTLLLVNVLDLPKQSNIIVDIICDYCGQEYTSSLDNRYKYFTQCDIKKDACICCGAKKREEVFLLKYGVTNPMFVQEFRENMYVTNLIKYGEKIPAKNPIIRVKINQTIREKYGVDNVMQNEGVKEKTKHTCIEKYGVPCVLQNEDIKKQIISSIFIKYGVTAPCKNKDVLEKMKQTNLKKYGVEFLFQNEDFIKQSKITMYNSQTQQCSKQQRYIWENIGGKLNYPVDRLSLDIAFPDEMIYIEYNGGGHDLGVKLGFLSEQKFQQKEIKRYLFLKSLGWKQIKIISVKDYVPIKEDLINIINEAKYKISYENLNHINIELCKENLNYRLIKL